MLTIKKTPRARHDLVDNALYIGKDSPDAGLRFLDAAENTFQRLLENPQIGSAYPADKHPLLRCFPVVDFRKYLVF
jgi:plasmid stabilization system protein ParE